MNSQNSEICTLLKRMVFKDSDESPFTISPNITEWAIQTRLGSCLIDYLDTNHFDKKLTTSLNAESLTAKFWFQTQYQATLELIAELNKNNITPTLLKGMSISTELYPKAHYRSMRDIDILVKDHEIEIVESIMLKLGYTQSSHLPLSFYETHHHTIPWQHKKNDIWFEIHRKLFPQTSACSNTKTFQLSTINNEKITSIIDDKNDSLQVYRLSNELQIIYIAAHWAESFKQIGGLFAFIDTALLINNTPINWKKLTSFANYPYIANYTYIVLANLIKNNLIDSLTNLQHLNQIKHSLSIVDVWVLNKIISRYLFNGKSFGKFLSVDNISILWNLFISNKNPFKKIFLAPIYIIFPPRSEQRFNISFQLSRIKNLLFKSAG